MAGVGTCSPGFGVGGGGVRVHAIRRAHFWREFLHLVGWISAGDAWNFCSREVGREMVRLRVLMIHPSMRFLDVHAALYFWRFFVEFGFCHVEPPGLLGLKNLYKEWKT